VLADGALKPPSPTSLILRRLCQWLSLNGAKVNLKNKGGEKWQDLQ
jgi:hypothetical protein